jgi:AcrR family transcriptional regulator
MSASIHHDSSHFDTISETKLSPAQAQVIASLAQGRSVTAAALEAGIHRTTVHHWFRHEPAFELAVQHATAEYAATLNDGMRDLAALALETLHNLLADPETPPAVRLKAALAVLERPHFPKEGWHLPERIESPRERQVLDGLAKMEADWRAMRMTGAAAAKAPQNEAEIAAPVARNAPCPCGSDKKYKRCCGSASPGKFTQTAAAAA